MVLEPGDRLLMFSDGLVERRRESLDGRPGPAGRAARRRSGTGPAGPDELVRRMLAGAGDDDVALLG